MKITSINHIYKLCDTLLIPSPSKILELLLGIKFFYQSIKMLSLIGDITLQQRLGEFSKLGMRTWLQYISFVVLTW
jgi:hypothetical protein